MKTYFSLLALLALLTLTGCTSVALKEPIGTPVTTFDNDDIQLEGEWIGTEDKDGENIRFTVTRIPDTTRFTAKPIGKNQEAVREFVLTQIQETENRETFFIWEFDKEEKIYRVGRIVGADNAVVILIPDADQIQAWIKEGKISGTKTEETWLLQPEGVAPLLTSKDFWSLGASLIYHQKPKAPAPEEKQKAPVTVPGHP